MKKKAAYEKNEFRRRVKFLLWRDDITMKEAAGRAGINVAQLSSLLSGKIDNPHVGTVQRIALAFDVPTYWLLGAGDINDAIITANN